MIVEMLYYCNKYNFGNIKAKNLTVVLTNEVYVCVCVCVCMRAVGTVQEEDDVT